MSELKNKSEQNENPSNLEAKQYADAEPIPELNSEKNVDELEEGEVTHSSSDKPKSKDTHIELVVEEKPPTPILAKKYERREYKKPTFLPPPKQFDLIMEKFWGEQPYVKNSKINNELEVRFGTKGNKYLTKMDYDNTIAKIKSLGFTTFNPEGRYMLRIENEYLDPSGRFKSSPIRTEVEGFNAIQDYCKNNSIRELMKGHRLAIGFVKKSRFFFNDTPLFPADFSDFNFRVSFQTEENINDGDGRVKGMINSWEKSKKTFRYINRVTFTHEDYPVNVDISITKASYSQQARSGGFYTTQEAGVFTNRESYEIELEIDNSKIGPKTEFDSPGSIQRALRKVIKFVLNGLQGTNFPVAYPELTNIGNQYLKIINGDNDVDFNSHRNLKGKGDIKGKYFIGPSSYTLQIENIAPINENARFPNIRTGYTVTDKADGERTILIISNNGKIYLMNSNMKISFTGAQTNNKEYFNTVIDGEIIHCDKNGKFINLYAAFDVYFVNNKDVRTFGFIQSKPDDKPEKLRLPILRNIIRNLNAFRSDMPEETCPIRITCKRFYPANPEDNIFAACNFILKQEDYGYFEYNTDGLIFTPANMGVGGNKVGEAGPLSKKTWIHSFKWKPPKYNTIDFLVKTKKTATGSDLVTPIFQSGINAQSVSQLDEYKTLLLCVGFDEKEHGYLNPCQDVIDDNLPELKNLDNESSYKKAVFMPTNPPDPTAGICHIMLSKDETGVNQMFTEENEVFGDDTIVEFSYDLSLEGLWRWIPLRVRYDKTTDYKNGASNYGNAFHVANSNWRSIHNPITAEMIRTGTNIPDEIANDDVYYNIVTKSNIVRGMRDFHNLFVKSKLIKSVSKKGDTLIDYACGKGGDFPKWIAAHLSFVFGIDVSKDNLENRVDGACARFLNFRKDFKNMPYALFVNGNSSQNISSGAAMLNDRAIQITKAVFGHGTKDASVIGAGVARQWGKGADGFNISSCQFALHYFFENQKTLHNYMRNLAECTKIGGYFIGTCYDGKLVYNMLKGKSIGESVQIYDEAAETKIWEIRKEYEYDTFDDDVSSVGYKIDVYQESINKMIPEYLVNFDYLNRLMVNYGFELVEREEAQNLGLPEGSGLFSELFNSMLEEIKKIKFKKKEYGEAPNMNANERKISFLNRYFVYKKLHTVNAEKVVNELMEETFVERTIQSKMTIASDKLRKYKKDSSQKGEESLEKSRPIKLKKKLVLVEATEALEEEQQPPIVLAPKVKKARTEKAKKVKLKIEE
uniref:mRNA (guanine-N(7))-methyltransferase n=1 Tax=viral metagenome TaxID=1070528 RepID=A0A6C0KYG7_9ZZZZ